METGNLKLTKFVTTTIQIKMTAAPPAKLTLDLIAKEQQVFAIMLAETELKIRMKLVMTEILSLLMDVTKIVLQSSISIVIHHFRPPVIRSVMTDLKSEMSNVTIITRLLMTDVLIAV